MPEVRLGIVGSGFIARHFALNLEKYQDFPVGRVLTRRPAGSVGGFPDRVITNSVDDLVSHVDVVVECSGDPVWATVVVEHAVEAGVPVVTMNTEFHITTGSAFVGRGLISEAEGDQPGCLAALHEDAVAMGFRPLAYGNMKGFLNLDPSPEEMAFWGEKQGISLPMVTSFTDGTKVQAEQVLVGNHFGADLIQEGMLGAPVADLAEGAAILADHARRLGRRVTDFVVATNLPHGVFIVAEHDDSQQAALEYFKLGPGPNYTLVKNNIFVHLEILKTVRRLLETGRVLLDNSARPGLSLGAVAKRDLDVGERIPQGIGSFSLRGHAIRIREHPDHLPIGLIADAVIEAPVDRGELITEANARLPDTSAASMWRKKLLPALLADATGGRDRGNGG